MSDTDETHVVLIGFTIDDSELSKLLANDKRMPVQTHKFAWSVVRALESAGFTVGLISAVPSSSFPHNKTLLYRGGAFVADGRTGRRLFFVNVLGLKHVTRGISLLVAGVKALKKRKTCVVLVHGVHSPFLTGSLVLRLLYRVRVVAILTDPPGVTLAEDRAFVASMKALDRRFVRWLLKRLDGLICVSDPLGADLAPDVPRLIVDGFAPPLDKPVTPNEQGKEHSFDVVYAGGLVREYGVDRLVNAIRGMTDPRVRLRLFGRGDLEPWIVQQAAVDHRISPAAFLDPANLAAELTSAGVLVNPRPIQHPSVRYAFPSKIFDYLAARRPVVTTRLETMSDEFADAVLFSDSDSAEGIRAAIEYVRDLPPDRVEAMCQSAGQFLATRRSVEVQGQRIKEFLNRIHE